MNECTVNDVADVYQPRLLEKICVLWANRWVPLNRLARWWLKRQLKDPGLYIAYEANIAMRLYDLQCAHASRLSTVDTHIELTIFTDTGNFNFKNKEHRDEVAVDLMQLVFDAPVPKGLKL
jgi:hypothetical protein